MKRTFLILAVLSLFSFQVIADLTTGQVLAWNLDETGGGNAADATGNGRGGTMFYPSYALTWVSGLIGNGLHGDNHDHTMRYTGDLGCTTECTFNLWINFDNLSGEGWYLYSDLLDIEGDRYLDNSFNNSVNGINLHITTMSLTTGSWYMVTWRYKRNALASVYVNAGLVYAYAKAAPDSNLPSQVGNKINLCGFTGYDASSAGVYDIFGVWSRSLSDAEVTQLYNSGAGLQYPYSTSSPGHAKTIRQYIGVIW